MPPAGMQWNNYGWTQQPQAAVNDNSLWAQVMAPQVQLPPGPPQMAAPQQQISTLPVPYSIGQVEQQRTLMPLSQEPSKSLISQQPDSLQPALTHDSAALAPAFPLEEPLHIPPMYTKPRAIIPTYRAISGLLSVLIVFTLLCTGATYLAKTTGKLSFVHVLLGDYRPHNLKPAATPVFAAPKTTVQYGPAANIITSATTASQIDLTTFTAPNPDTVFQVNQIIYLTYSVHPNSRGVVSVKWYTNNIFYQSSPPIPFQDMKAKNGYAEMQYAQPAEGIVELYWNNQLAVRLFFVVQ